MATRFINSPGVQIMERDFSLIAPANVGTNVFITGYAAQGPTDEVLKITSRDELDAIYGTPTNSAERYFYHGIRELLNSPANIYTTRLPYGQDAGAGFGSQYSVLAYPGIAYSNETYSVSSGPLSAPVYTYYNVSSSVNFETLSTGTILVGSPTQFVLDEDQYNLALQGELFNWSNIGGDTATLSALEELGKAAFLVFNKAQTTINPQFEGYYIGVVDNVNLNPGTPKTSIIGIETVSFSALTHNDTTYTQIPEGTLQFNLTGAVGSQGSVSDIMERLTDYDIDGREDDDVLSIGVFKLRKSLYATDAYKLDYVLEDRIVGSMESHRLQQSQNGGPATSFFIESQDEASRNVEIFVNPYVSNRNNNEALDSNGHPLRKVRILSNSLISNNLSAKSGLQDGTLATTTLIPADNLYPVGAYSNQKLTDKVLGSIPSKVTRALDSVKNDEIYDIDIVVEAGLGTMHVATEQNSVEYYDETAKVPNISALQTSSDLDVIGRDVRADYSTIFNIFENFCNLPANTGGRGDCMFIADPIRHILVTGKNYKTLIDKSKNFQQHIYWAMRHQFKLENTSYAATYANWAQIYDEFLGEKVWVPFSSVAAAIYAKSDAVEFPWSAPAGYTRGLVSGNVVDIAITPNQKQRDELYKSNLNPVLFSPSQGMAIFGQKTMSRKPSAFDRVNVRRLFLALERPTKKASIFYVFEPNNEFTRTRFVNTLTPIFEYAKQNGGLYDYLIICDERNNTPEVIDNNEMRCDIYLKPTRTAEYIIVSFYATRTDANFEELIGG